MDSSSASSWRCTVVVQWQRWGAIFATVQQRFFEELAGLMERAATYQVSVYIAGDFNICLDRSDDVHATQLRRLIDCYGLLLHDSVATH